MERETDKTHFQIKTTKKVEIDATKKRGRKIKAMIQKWRRGGILCS